MRHVRIWLDIIIPFVAKWSDFGRYPELCRRNTHYMENGWEFGDVNPNNVPLNKSVYDVDQMDREGRIAIWIDLTKDARRGRVCLWRGDIDRLCPLFVRPKKLDPITDAVIAWRVIRDGTKSTPRTASINDLTPDASAALTLVNHERIQSYVITMYLLYGPGFMMGKADLAGAFRQFYMKPLEAQKVIYRVVDRYVGDLAHIWGTRTGSRICDNHTTLGTRYLMIWINGTALLHDINAVTEKGDWQYVRRKLRFSASVQLNPHLDHGVVDIWNWTETEVREWFTSNDLTPAIQMLGPIRRGNRLLALNENTARLWTDADTVSKLKQLQFFRKLLDLKLESDCVLKLILTQYVDDFMLFLPPDRDYAQHLFEYICSWLDKVGYEEEASKRIELSTEMEHLGITYDSTTMTMYLSDLKRRRYVKLLLRGIHRMAVTLEEYRTILGKLTYAASLVWPCKAFLRRIRTRVLEVESTSGGCSQTIVILTDWELQDWYWWIDYLRAVPKVDIIRKLMTDLPKSEIFVDGATNGSKEKGWNPGLGVFFEGRWISVQVPARYLTQYQSRHTSYVKDYAIAHFEMLAILVALHNLRDVISEYTNIMLRTDSQHVESALKSKNSSDEFLMSAVRWIIMFAIKHNIQFYCRYVNTKLNLLADDASRFALSKLLRNAKQKCAEKGWKLRRLRNIKFPKLDCE